MAFMAGTIEAPLLWHVAGSVVVDRDGAHWRVTRKQPHQRTQLVAPCTSTGRDRAGDYREVRVSDRKHYTQAAR